MRQAGKVFSLYKTPEEIFDLEERMNFERIFNFRKFLLIEELRKNEYVVNEIERNNAQGNPYITRHEIMIRLEDGYEEVGIIEEDEIITRDCKSLDKFLEDYVIK